MAFFQVQFQARIGIEMVFNGPFRMAADDEDFFDAALQASSTIYWIVGLSTIGSISFGVAFVAGRKRVPNRLPG